MMDLTMKDGRAVSVRVAAVVAVTDDTSGGCFVTLANVGGSDETTYQVRESRDAVVVVVERTR
jgi:hypothetical protein